MLSPARTRLYGIALLVIGLPLFPAMLHYVTTPGNGSDFEVFWTAASMVGTPALLNPVAHVAWGHAHGLAVGPFVYIPAAAWLLSPLSHLSIGLGFVANAVFMFAICVIAGLLAANVYRLDRQCTLFGVLAWAPATVAMLTGQNSPFGLLLTLAAILGFTRERTILTGTAVGVLLYKPTYALPLILLLLVFRRWSALAIVCAFCALWYLFSVSATAGDWAWPLTYTHVLSAYAGPDFAFNADKFVSLPGIALRFGVPSNVAYVSGALLLVGSAFLLARAPSLEAASVIPLIGLAASPHALEYDAVLVLPSIFYAVKHLADPWRTRLICGAYLFAAFWQYALRFGKFDSLAVVVIAATLGWCLMRMGSLTHLHWNRVRFAPSTKLNGGG